MHSIKKTGQSFWYITPVSLTDRPILGMVVGNNKTLMIDAGNSEDHADYFIQKTLKYENAKPDMVVLTHWHWDHIFGLPALSDAVSIASAKTRKEMEKLLPFSWSDEAIDDRVREGTEIEFCAKAIKKNIRNIEIFRSFYRMSRLTVGWKLILAGSLVLCSMLGAIMRQIQ